MRKLWKWIRGTFPLIRYESHGAAMDKVNAAHGKQVNGMRAAHLKEINAEHRKVEEMMGRLIKVEGKYAAGRFIISTQLSEDFVYSVLSRAAAYRDSRELDYLAERMAYDIARQMRTIDFARVRASADYDDHRRQSVSWANPNGQDFDPYA